MKQQTENIKIMISGGGTGGHIFPAIAIAKAIQKIRPSAEFLFVGAKGKMEMERVPQAGFAIEGLWISGFQRNLSRQNLTFPFKLVSSLWKARQIIKKFKPQVVVGVGGFASGPTLKMASRMGIPCLIQEQNSYPGITNKLLAKQVQKICVAYDNMDKYFPKEKILLTGNPIRQEVIHIEGKKEKAQAFFSLTPDKKTLLIVGGSLGAQSINKAIINHIDKWESTNIQLIWQTGKTNFEEAKQAAASAPNIQVHEFIKQMDLAYAVADFIVSRAGAIAISEISAIGKAVIFVPFPYAAEDHQTKNAERLVEKNAAILIKDSAVEKQLFEEVMKLYADEYTRLEMAREIKKLGLSDADHRIAKEVIKLIK
ncbi:MAG: undecaprenyldiphospho-muramoylpentapeptide beta-N-acetylglucosaminyltransferase [Bacteroidetes bacterium 4572_77]|nr:MAG: undecaprenyldiphospho-muramoylpentapeptide beta-N-acetylglucosaminyltransferase [Bacteroidetes bacterium 4572_77]